MIVQMHKTLLSLEDSNFENAQLDEFYEVDCFKTN